jgi:predicted phosphohydrolase
MDCEAIFSRSRQPWKGETMNTEKKDKQNDEKVEIYIREIIRVKMSDIEYVRKSFEQWAKQFD